MARPAWRPIRAPSRPVAARLRAAVHRTPGGANSTRRSARGPRGRHATHDGYGRGTRRAEGSMERKLVVVVAAVLCACVAATVGGSGSHAQAAGPRTQPKQPVAYGSGGGAATMSSYATAA